MKSEQHRISTCLRLWDFRRHTSALHPFTASKSPVSPVKYLGNYHIPRLEVEDQHYLHPQTGQAEDAPSVANEEIWSASSTISSTITEVLHHNH